MARFAILLPPSEGKREGGNPFAPDMFDYRSSNTFNYFNDLNPERKRIISVLHETMEAGRDLEELLCLKGENLAEAVRINEVVLDAPLMSVLERYSPGVMYQAMDFQGLPTGAQRRLLENGIIFSGLFGLLRPDDLIPNYRLRMNAVLPGIGKVSDFWRPFISPLLNAALQGKTVFNLLPGIHREAWDDDESYAVQVEIRFFTELSGERTALSHGIKPLRGNLVNFIVRETVDEPERIREWEAPSGYRLDEASTEEEGRTIRYTFVRPG